MPPIRHFIFASVPALMVGCSPAPTPTSAPELPPSIATSSQGTGFVSSLPQDAPVISVGMSGIDMPFSFTDAAGNLEGFEADLMRAIGENQGFRVDFYKTQPTQLLSELDAGKFDLVLSMFSDTPARQASYAVSAPYASAGNAIVWTNTGLNIHSSNDLGALSVAVEENSDVADMLSTQNLAAHIEEFGTPYLVFSALLQGQTDAAIMNSGIAQYYITQNADRIPGDVHTIAFDAQSEAPLIMLAPKNAQGNELISKVNAGLEAIKASGEFTQLEQKWFGAAQ